MTCGVIYWALSPQYFCAKLTDMIQASLLLIEYAAINDPTKNRLKLIAIQGIKNLLIQIDFKAELVPMESVFKLKELLESLKGKPLTHDEERIIDELILMNKNENKL